MLTLREFQQPLLSHPLTPAGPIPTAQDPDGVYPYESFVETSRRPVLRAFRFVAMENDHLRVVICPDLGGKVHSLYLKRAQRETLYVSPAVHPIRILPRGAYVGGGIEVSFPISHTPVQIEPVLCRAETRGERAYVWCGERELRFGMHWTVEYSLGRDDAFLTQRTVFFNPAATAHPWMSWSNAGVLARPDTEFHFPKGPVLKHGDKMQIITWETEGPKRQADIDRMAGFFWRDASVCAFGAFTPSLGCGLYHIADPKLTPGIKLWSDGVGKHEPWVSQYTLAGEQVLEIQAGPLVDQSIKDHLQPQQRRYHVEFWIPSDKPLDIDALQLPRPELAPLDDVPRFGWARKPEVERWESVLAAHTKQARAQLPAPPDVTDNHWAPCGMEALGDALRWAAESSAAPQKDAWLFQLGAWRAGRNEIDAALDALRASGDDRARALAGRLLRRHKQDARAAVESFRAIQSETFALHPQVVFERDLALAELGAETFAERERWLDAVVGLDDEWLIERRAVLLVDAGKFADAKRLLESTRFQLVHQRYARTRLWTRIKAELGITTPDPPNWLGEDDLAEFGAYREYQED